MAHKGLGCYYSHFQAHCKNPYLLETESEQTLDLQSWKKINGQTANVRENRIS